MKTQLQAIPDHLAPQRGELIMFEDNRLLERLSRIRPATVLSVFIPAVLISFYLSLSMSVSLLNTVGLFLGGAVFWTLFEYLFHRFVFHFEPKGEFQTHLQFVMHGVHHQYPHDKDRLVMPITVSIPMAALLFGAFWLVLGEMTFGFFSGFMVGYLIYDMMHYALHHAETFQSAFFNRVRKHHLAHHFRDTRKGFGVSSPLWDVIFRS